MVESFDEFAEKRKQQLQDRTKLEQERNTEWAMLKSFTEGLAIDGKEVDGYTFEWLPDSHAPSLVLGAVAAAFLQREKHGRLVDYLVRFDRKPLRANQVWVDGKSPFEPVEWVLSPVINGESIDWVTGESDTGRQVQYSSAALAERVGIRLAEFLIAYNQHYKSWGTTA